MEEDIIKRLKLTEQEVLNVVSEWYLNGMYPDVLLDENGNELCEITQMIYDRINYEEKKVK